MPKNKDISYRSAVLYLAELIKPHGRWYFLAAGLAVVSAGTGLLHAKTAQRLIDGAAAGRLREVLFCAAVFALLIAVNFLIARVSGASVARLAARASRDLKRRAADALLRGEYLAVLRLQAGDALSTVNEDTKTVSDFLGGDCIGILAQALTALAALVYVFLTDWRLALLTFAYTPVGMCFTLRLNAKMQRLYPLRADQAGQALSVMEQALMQVPVIKSFFMERRVRRRVAEHCEEVRRTEMRISLPNALLQSACSSVSQIPRLLYIIFAGGMALRGALSLGTFVAVFDLLTFIIGPTVYFPFLLNSLNRAAASANRVRRLETLPRAWAQAVESAGAVPAIALENLTFGYPDSPLIFDKFNFTHTGPGLVALKGRSGGGKTTLLDLLAGLLRPGGGGVLVSGAAAAMTQDSFLFAGSVLENVRAGRPDTSKEEVDEALSRAGAADFVAALPQGIHTPVGDGGAGLSGGQRQRLSLARALLSDATVWLLDEPTAALDAQTEALVLDALAQARKTRLIVAATHRESLLAMADAVLDLDTGEVRT